MRTCAPAGDALSWASCLSLLALVPSLCLVVAEDEKLLGGRRQMCGCHSYNKLKHIMLPAVLAEKEGIPDYKRSIIQNESLLINKTA